MNRGPTPQPLSWEETFPAGKLLPTAPPTAAAMPAIVVDGLDEGGGFGLEGLEIEIHGVLL
jgi:hypothetical protein